MILILTPYSFNPLHPRLEYIEKYLVKNGYSIKKYNLNCNSRIVSKLNWLSLTFFQIPAFLKSFKYLWRHRKEIDIVYIQDLQYIHISIVVKLFRKKVIYDTLDNNVELNFYHLANRFSIFKKAKFLKLIISFLEKKIAKYFCNQAIVNSKALVDYFRPLDVSLIYYTSPFEKKFEIDYKKKDIAFLYLGGFWKMKGSNLILEFVEKYEIKLFIFGMLNQNEKDILLKIELLKNKGLLEFTNRLPSIELEGKLKILMDNYRFIGFSLIQNVNLSYETQEINKDIDYLAMGIPIIGNHRKPTEEKIDAGCGIFVEDDNSIKRLLEDSQEYEKISKKSIEYYNKSYSQKIFEQKLLKVIKNV